MDAMAPLEALRGGPASAAGHLQKSQNNNFEDFHECQTTLFFTDSPTMRITHQMS